ncbi:MAG: ECF transporter S component, partial [Thaumarchaeota archaeon]|nr:ECF transporter S component [Nitrososphaerota archaeon]
MTSSSTVAVHPLKTSRRISAAGVMSALIAVLTVTAFPLPPPLSTITLAPFAIFIAGVYFGPWVGFVASLIGSGVGFVAATSVGTISLGGLSVLFPVFLVGIMVARGPEGLIIGLLRKSSEAGAMIAGTVYETLAFFTIDYLYTYPILLALPREFA